MGSRRRSSSAPSAIHNRHPRTPLVLEVEVPARQQRRRECREVLRRHPALHDVAAFSRLWADSLPRSRRDSRRRPKSETGRRSSPSAHPESPPGAPAVRDRRATSVRRHTRCAPDRASPAEHGRARSPASRCERYCMRTNTGGAQQHHRKSHLRRYQALSQRRRNRVSPAPSRMAVARMPGLPWRAAPEPVRTAVRSAVTAAP